MDKILERIFPSEEPRIAVLTAGIISLLFLLSLLRFRTFSKQPSLSSQPRDARLWTTHYNYVFSAVIYGSVVVIVYGIFTLVPEAAYLIFKNSGRIPSAKEILESSQLPSWAIPMIGLAVLIVLFATDKSPFFKVECFVRDVLQRIASIPTKVEYVVNAMKEATFDRASNRGVYEGEIGSLLSIGKEEFGVTAVREADFGPTLLKVLTVRRDIATWKSKSMRLRQLAEECDQQLNEAEDKIANVSEKLHNFLYMLEAKDPDTPLKGIEIQSELEKIEDLQYGPFACRLLQESNGPQSRRRFLSDLGFQLRPPPPYFAFRSMLQDIATMILLAIFVIYPVSLAYAWLAFKWSPTGNSAWDLIFVWPTQVGIFSLAMTLPPLIFVDLAERESNVDPIVGWLGTRGPIHALAYLLSALMAILMVVIGLVVVRVLADCLFQPSLSTVVTSLHEFGPKAAPFAITAAGVSLGLALLFDLGSNFTGRFLLEGLAIAAILVITAAFAFQSQHDDMSLTIFELLNPFEVALKPEYKPFLFVEIVAGLLGFVIGTNLPSGYRRYKRGLSSIDVPRPLAKSMAPPLPAQHPLAAASPFNGASREGGDNGNLGNVD